MELATAADNWEEIVVDLIGRHFPAEVRDGKVWQSHWMSW